MIDFFLQCLGLLFLNYIEALLLQMFLPSTASMQTLIVLCSQVECPKYPGFCLTRQKNEYPFIEVFYNPEQVIILHFTSHACLSFFCLEL
jgi:hypothetical protein